MPDERDFIMMKLDDLAIMIGMSNQKLAIDVSFVLGIISRCVEYRAEDTLTKYLIALMIEEDIGDYPIARKPKEIQ